MYKQNKISIKYYTKILLWYSSIRVAKIMVSLIDILEIDYILAIVVWWISELVHLYCKLLKGIRKIKLNIG